TVTGTEDSTAVKPVFIGQFTSAGDNNDVLETIVTDGTGDYQIAMSNTNTISGLGTSTDMQYTLSCTSTGSLAGKYLIVRSVEINDTEYDCSDVSAVAITSNFNLDIIDSTDPYGILQQMGATDTDGDGKYTFDTASIIREINVNFTISDIPYIPEKLYTQKTSVSDGKYSQRWVCLVSKSDLANYTSATFTITRASDSKKMTKSVTTAYKSISASGSGISYDGYYWVCYSMTGIPENVTLTGSIVLNEKSQS
ncbi:MAG: hypothetical protein K6B41_13550, partial [Butyrivibrio sp.]|nr:hypothetical protein [Butyrivibrio sp.]